MNKNFREILRENILLLDGALGTNIQNYKLKENDFRGREFLTHSQPLFGFNDLLNITKPSVITKIHCEYIKAGADIITTNTFNSNSISMIDYGLDKIHGLVNRLNKEGVLLVNKAIKEINANRPIFIGGSIGPTNRSASMSPDISDPLKRNVSYQELFEAYQLQAEGLIEGGIDLFICETFFDTLNLKAAIDGVNHAMQKWDVTIPIMVSATISDKAGRILSGQSLKAFIISISNLPNVEIVGLNCGFGPDRMVDYIKELGRITPHYISCHPNAGLPDETGCYDIGPKEFVSTIRPLLEGNLNIIGGCCGTTPQFIHQVRKLLENQTLPHLPIKRNGFLKLSGLDPLEIKEDFILVGERCNVAGSRKFLCLINEGNFEEAAEIAKSQIKAGAQLIDINMDDPLLDSKEAMVKFLRYILAEPDVARIPFMIDSSKWDVLEHAMENIQGKGIINSLSLKEGEEIFIERAKRVQELGFALIVMAFDEKGQADTMERKIEICKRSYDILTQKCGFHPQDIIFDVNIMTIATGMKEHSRYAIDFIKAVEWIKENLPEVRISGGLSNLSFAFRGKNKIREYMHVVFLYHARKAGMDMAIINPAHYYSINEVPEEIRHIIEDIIFDRDNNSLEKLIEIANEEVIEKGKKQSIKKSIETLTAEELLIQDLIEGETLNIKEHIEKALQEIEDPVKIIEGPLLEGMKKVGDFFGEGKMFLPQVVKTARTMKKAVEILTPLIKEKIQGRNEKKAGKILIATVKGDVHDIGKNIVSTVLSCNNYEVIDLGIMVSAEKILENVLKEKPDIINLSGLITPSLAEMTNTVRKLKEAGITTPIMVGGAATSLIHTALKIAPYYSGPVLHMVDASQNPIASSRILGKDTKMDFIREIKLKYDTIRKEKGNKGLVPFQEVSQIVKSEQRNEFINQKPDITLGEVISIDLELKDILPHINWKMFFTAWKVQGGYLNEFPYSLRQEDYGAWISKVKEEDLCKAEEAYQLYKTAIDLIGNFPNFDGKALVRFEKVSGDDYGFSIGEKYFPMLRQQSIGSDFLSCSDFIGIKDYIGLFVVTAGQNIQDLAKEYDKKGESYHALILQTIADRLVEAASEWLQDYVTKHFIYVSIRPAWGYPMLPDQSMILETEEFLPYGKIGVKLTENGAMYPPATISGIYLSDHKSRYFMVGEIGEDQLNHYSNLRKLSLKRIKEILAR